MGGQGRDDPLALDREAMRQLGYRTIDLLVEQLEREEPPLRRATPAEMRERLHSAPPEQLAKAALAAAPQATIAP